MYTVLLIFTFSFTTLEVKGQNLLGHLLTVPIV